MYFFRKYYLWGGGYQIKLEGFSDYEYVYLFGEKINITALGRI